jgi:hypothetical protein
MALSTPLIIISWRRAQHVNWPFPGVRQRPEGTEIMTGGASGPLMRIGETLLRRANASAVSSTRHQPRSSHDEYPHTLFESSRWSTFGDTTKKCVACSM